MSLVKKIARKRIKILFEMCEKEKEFADLYINLIWRIVKRTKVRLTKKEKKLFCRKCLRYWGKNVKKEKWNFFYIYSCPYCGYSRKFI